MPVTVTVGKPKPPARRSRRAGGRRRKGVLTGMWGAVSALCTVLFLAVESTFMLVALILSVAMVAITAVAEYAEIDLPAPPVRRNTAGKPIPRGNRRPPIRPRRSGTAKPRKTVCSAACQRSNPRSPCECKGCGGRMSIDPKTGAKRGHGSKYPGRT